MSHAIIGDWLDKARAGYAIAAGGHHGFFVHNERYPDIGEQGRPLRVELSDQTFAPHRDEIRKVLAGVF
ncbi:MAG: hypothetical protein ACOYMN_18190, partial [Roseimicrobium sp.]